MNILCLLPVSIFSSVSILCQDGGVSTCSIYDLDSVLDTYLLMIDFSSVYPAEASRLNYEFPLPPAEKLPQPRLFCLPAESVYA